ncbi:hypothetical protein KYB31_04045 [Clostridium felsineum]|uniref:hypothetical protein n=1 Tax=Clostridium felsineum TaxID=36839 RepID=UPI00214D1D4C|nr:hypothetical protein [Clostridium felsineum]MCR3758169.1 hypothetical protein [Clostridium felsineum]
MESKFDEFNKANNELKEFINLGLFGEEAKELVNKFKNMDHTEYYGECLDSWLESDQYYKDETKYYIEAFFMIFLDAYEKDSERLLNELLWFIEGNRDENRDENRVENVTAYKEYLTNYNMCWNEIEELIEQDKNKIVVKKVSNLIINNYSKGVEFISRIYSLLIIVFCIIDKKKVDIENINKKTLYQKCNCIKKRRNKYCDLIIDCIDRNIRNSEVHLNATYDFDKKAYIFRITKNGKFKNCEISYEYMIFNIYPKVGGCIKGFMSAIDLIIIIINDMNKGMEYISKIFN